MNAIQLQNRFKEQIAKAFPNGGTTLLKSETEAARRMSAKIRNEIKEDSYDKKTKTWYKYDTYLRWIYYLVPIKNNRGSVSLSQEISLKDDYVKMQYDDCWDCFSSIRKFYSGKSKMSCNLDNTRSEVCINSIRNIYDQNDSDCIKIPTPVLKTENGVSKTIYKNSQDDMKQVDLKNISFEDLKNVVLKLEERKNDEELRFAYINEKVFRGKLDKLVEKAHDAIRTVSPSAKMIKVYLEDGERMDVTKLSKDASKFNITLYNKKNEVTLDGKFSCNHDRNDNVLKRKSEGKIVNSDDANYNNPNNVLDYYWKGSIHGLRKFMGQEYVEQGRENLEAIKTIEKQYEAIKKFEDCRGTVFDKPVELATEAYNQIQNDTPDGQIEIIDLNDEGERLEVQKQGDVFNINFYNEDNKLSMQGTFKILKDGGVPLKENKEGKIFKPGDPGYDNEGNKLCFDIKLETYYSDIQKLACQFERTINLNEKKQRHTMSAQQFNRKGEELPNGSLTFNFTLPKYTEDWAKGRLCKMYYETSKHELKEIKANFEHNMLCPQDLNLIKITNKNAASLLARNKKEILDFPTELATTAYEYVINNPDHFQNEREYERINLADGKSITVCKYNDNQSHYHITLFNRDSKPTMNGLFRFSNEHLLKENNEGKIFKPGEEGYDNQDNKLCFPMWYEVLTPDTGKKTFKFTRDIEDSGEKKAHSISMQQFDGNDNILSGTSENICLDQILPIKITNENAASFLASNKKTILDFPTELATRVYKYVKQNPNYFQTPLERKHIKLTDDKFIEVFKFIDCNDNQSDYQIILYNMDSKKTMEGLFRFSDKDCLLKENNEGKIFKPGEEGYDNQDNKLCFPMSYVLYNPDTDKRTFEFMRNIEDSGEKKVHRISMQQYDGYYGNFLSGTSVVDGIKLEQILPNPEA